MHAVHLVRHYVDVVACLAHGHHQLLEALHVAAVYRSVVQQCGYSVEYQTCLLYTSDAADD